MNYLEFKILWTDDDGMVKLGVRASSFTHTAYHETYLYPIVKFLEQNPTVEKW